MIVGDASRFGLESEIAQAFEGLGQLALGFFAIHVNGLSFGVREPDASLLAVSYDEVGRRLQRRGRHVAPSLERSSPELIATAILGALYDPTCDEMSFLGRSRSDFTAEVKMSHAVWAPDGDEAFDDGSRVLQIDCGNEVRVVAFRATMGYRFDTSSLRDVFLPESEFYRILETWRSEFMLERQNCLRQTSRSMN